MTKLMNVSISCVKCEANTQWTSVKETVNEGFRQCGQIEMFGQVALIELSVMR